MTTINHTEFTPFPLDNEQSAYLRDQIAVSALNGLLSGGHHTQDYCVERAYQIADEMMAQRNK